MPKQIEDRLRVNSKYENGSGKEYQHDFGDHRNRDASAILSSIPIHGFDDFEVVVKTSSYTDKGDAEQPPRDVIGYCRFKDEELSPEASSERDASQRRPWQ